MLAPFPDRITARLEHWARIAPDRVFLARRGAHGGWESVTYAQALAAARALGAALVARGLSPDRPVAILSGNGIEHALLALACLHVGVPYTPVSVAYSLVSTDFGKLRHILDVLTPGLVFAEDGERYAPAIAAAVPAEVALVVAAKPPPDRPATLLADLRATDPAGSDAAAARVGPDTVAKILFTSGSTGLPKGVVNTQRMICANQQQILQAFPFMAATPPVIVDWLPWNHTFGGNHNFGLVLYNGGSLYIDDGKPVPGGMDESIRNLREIAPTVYFNVPKGYEELVRHLRDEPDLRRIFFSRVQLLFYSGAGLAQHVWDALEALALQTVGERITMLTGLGSTETAPFSVVCRPDCAGSGVVGLPAAGVELKLVPVEDKMEARVRGPNIMPGYWRAPAATRDAFDEEGFYKFGDALRFVDPARPDLGFAFDGRITEDFKLSTGTWVSVGPLRARLVQRGAPWVRDAVIAGINQDYVAVLIVPDAACAALPAAELHATLRRLLRDLAAESTGSSNRVVRALVLHDRLDIDAGEVTDKGSLNQRAVLRHRADKVAALYADPKSPDVISIENDAG